MDPNTCRQVNWAGRLGRSIFSDTGFRLRNRHRNKFVLSKPLFPNKQLTSNSDAIRPWKAHSDGLCARVCRVYQGEQALTITFRTFLTSIQTVLLGLCRFLWPGTSIF